MREREREDNAERIQTPGDDGMTLFNRTKAMLQAYYIVDNDSGNVFYWASIDHAWFHVLAIFVDALPT